MAASLAELRSSCEFHLRGRVSEPFAFRERNAFEFVPSGIPEIDFASRGLPRGAMTEVCGPPCSGLTTFLLAALASRTANGEACALVQVQDSFDPRSARAAGIALEQLLWVRCQNIDQALRAVELLIQNGGFGLIALDLADVSPRSVRHIPLHIWFRLRRSVEGSPTILMILEQESNAKTCASLALRFVAPIAEWSSPTNVQNASETSVTNMLQHPFARLLKGCRIGSEVIRSRMPSEYSRNDGSPAQNGSHDTGQFETRATWRDFCKQL